MSSQISKGLRIVLSLLCLTALSACGWQMRGWDQYQASKGENFPRLDNLNISYSSGDRSFYRSLLRVMRSQRITEDNQSTLRVAIDNVTRDRQPLTFSGASSPAQYELVIALNFAATRNGETLIAARPLVSRRNYDFDPNLIIAKDQEEQLLLEEMREELALQMLLLLRQAL
jgi:LPS-assembly lipoprotein